MTLPLAWLRYALIIIPAVAGVYLTPIPSDSLYILSILLFLVLVRTREKWAAIRVQWVLTIVECFGGIYLVKEFNGVFYYTFLSILVSLFMKQEEPYRLLLAVLVWGGMNASLYPFAFSETLVANLVFAMTCFMMLRGLKTEVRQEELQHLYDELRRKHYELDEARKQIVEYARKVEDSAQAEERNRIARDIHDDLGHKLIRLKMILEAVIRIMPGQTDKAMKLIGQVRDQLTESMDTMRATVRKLKPDDSVMQNYSIHKLIEELDGEGGIRVEYRIHGMPYPVYPSCEVALYRNAQEAITNAIRHGKAKTVSIDLYYEETQLAMTVSNDGISPENLEVKGLGLSGMEERTRLLGGSLYYDLGEKFSVTTRLPMIRG